MRTLGPGDHLLACHHGAQRHARGNALRRGDDIRLDPKILNRPPLAGAAHPRLHFIGNQQNAVLVAKLAQRREEARRRHNVTTLTLDRFNQDARNFISRD